MSRMAVIKEYETLGSRMLFALPVLSTSLYGLGDSNHSQLTQ